MFQLVYGLVRIGRCAYSVWKKGNIFLPRVICTRWCIIRHQVPIMCTVPPSCLLDISLTFLILRQPQWGAADAEIKVPSGENTERKRSPCKAWSRSVYSHTCYAYCQGFLPCLYLPFRSIQLHFSKISPDFSCVGCGHAIHCSCVGP